MNRVKATFAIGFLALALAAGSALAQDAPKPEEKAMAPEAAKKTEMAPKAKMNWYMITTTHTQEECLKAMDEAVKNKKFLSNTKFGCMTGDHTGWTAVQAADADAAKNMVPESMRESAKVVQVMTFTPAMIKEFHMHHDTKPAGSN